MYKIEDIIGRMIYDSRGFPTVEVDVILNSGMMGRASVPSGASKGSHESFEVRDNNDFFYKGKGVQKAVDNINSLINPLLKNMEIQKQRDIDQLMIDYDGTDNKARLGTNAILPVSLAVAKASALAYGLPFYQWLGGTFIRTLPIPFVNVINGGVHSDSGLSFQEFMLVPHGFETFQDALRSASNIFHVLKDILYSQGFSTSLGDEGGFAPALKSAKSVLEILLEAISKAGYTPEKEVSLALDCAATEFYKNDRYHISGQIYDKKAYVNYIKELVHNYPIVSIEDPMAEDDFEGWKLVTQALKSHCQIVGDDVFVTDIKRLEEGIRNGIATAILIKPNQVGTLTETRDVIYMAKNHGYSTMVSHRSGETEDTTIADLAVGFSTGQIKTGSFSRSERLAKYNALLRIGEALGQNARYSKLHERY